MPADTGTGGRSPSGMDRTGVRRRRCAGASAGALRRVRAQHRFRSVVFAACRQPLTSVSAVPEDSRSAYGSGVGCAPATPQVASSPMNRRPGPRDADEWFVPLITGRPRPEARESGRIYSDAAALSIYSSGQTVLLAEETSTRATKKYANSACCFEFESGWGNTGRLLCRGAGFSASWRRCRTAPVRPGAAGAG